MFFVRHEFHELTQIVVFKLIRKNLEAEILVFKTSSVPLSAISFPG